MHGQQNARMVGEEDRYWRPKLAVLDSVRHHCILQHHEQQETSMHACSNGPCIKYLAGSRLIYTDACTHLRPDTSV
jgi:hypothetical protein